MCYLTYLIREFESILLNNELEVGERKVCDIKGTVVAIIHEIEEDGSNEYSFLFDVNGKSNFICLKHFKDAGCIRVEICWGKGSNIERAKELGVKWDLLGYEFKHFYDSVEKYI